MSDLIDATDEENFENVESTDNTSSDEGIKTSDNNSFSSENQGTPKDGDKLENEFLSGLDEENELFEGEEKTPDESEKGEGEEKKEREEESHEKEENVENEEKSQEETDKNTDESNNPPSEADNVVNAEISSLRLENTALREMTTAKEGNFTFAPVLARFANANNITIEQAIENLESFCDEMGTPPKENFKPDMRTFVEEKATKEWKEFLEKYPQIKDPEKEFSTDAWEDIKKGSTPENAYLRQENTRLSDELKKALEEKKTILKNGENKKKSPGAVGNRQGTRNTNEDAFLKGLYEE